MKSNKSNSSMKTGPTEADPTKRFADHLGAPFAGLAAFLLPNEWAETTAEMTVPKATKKAAGGKKSK